MRKITRRGFIGAAGTAAAAAVVGVQRGEPSQAAAAGEAHAVSLPDEGRFVPTVCLQCDGGCGLVVRVVDGNAIKVDGNPSYPLNAGKTCPKGQAALQTLYDPDRLKGPIKRVGERGEGRWESIDWAEAVETVTRRLAQVRTSGHPERLAFLHGRTRGQMQVLIERFCQAFGTPNRVHHDSISSGALIIGHWLTSGYRGDFVTDIANARYVLAFGTGLIESSRPTIRQAQAYVHMRTGRPGNRGKLVQVEPRFSMTAQRADEWIPLRPGTDAALALGIAHVIVRDDLYDHDFVENYCFGFEGWTGPEGQSHEGFSELLDAYDPERVEELAGVPAATIERLATEFASHRPALALASRGATATSNGLYACMAIDALNALVGAFDRPGGLLRQLEPPLGQLPEVELDSIARQGLRQPRVDLAGTGRYPLAEHVYQEVASAIAQGQSRAPEVLLLYYTNPLFSAPNPPEWKSALTEIPFVVSFSPFMDDTTQMADLVLPDHTFLERWQDDICKPGMGAALWGIRQPVVEPLHKTRDTGDVLLDIAAKIGGSVAASLPWRTTKELIRARVNGVYESYAGDVFADSPDEWWTAFIDRGFWYDETLEYGEWKARFDTPSGRFEFYSQALQSKLDALVNPGGDREQLLAALGIGARGDEVFLPHYEPPRYVGDPEEYPYHFVTYKLMAHAEGRGANQPMLQEILGLHSHMKWDSWVEVAASTARELGIRDGREVIVESELGSVRTRAKVLPGAPPGILAMPFELGHHGGGRWAKDRGVNPNALLAPATEPLGGLAATSMTRVRIRLV